MRPQAPRRPLATRTFTMPAFQRLGGSPARRHRFSGVEQASIIALRAAEMLPPQLEPKIAGELTRAVTETCGIDGFPSIALLVKHRARDLGVVTPGPSIEIV